jgi:hypothetical protein
MAGETTKYAIRMSWRVWNTIDVEIPNGSTAEQIDAIVEAATDRADHEGGYNQTSDLEGWEYESAVLVVAPEPPREFMPPTDADWYDIDGHRWATDGFVLVRDDAPMPLGDFSRRGWRHDIPVDDIRKVMAGSTGPTPPQVTNPRHYNPVAAPVLLAGEVSEREDGAAVVTRDGEMIALVMCMRPAPGFVSVTLADLTKPSEVTP